MITLATTTISAHRPTPAVVSGDPYGDGYDNPSPAPAGDDNGQGAVVTRNTRAVIKPGSGRGISQGSESEVVEFVLTCDPVPALSYLDTVTDDSSGVTYVVVWALTSPGVAGLGHTTAGLRTTKGQSA